MEDSQSQLLNLDGSFLDDNGLLENYSGDAQTSASGILFEDGGEGNMSLNSFLYSNLETEGGFKFELNKTSRIKRTTDADGKAVDDLGDSTNNTEEEQDGLSNVSSYYISDSVLDASLALFSPSTEEDQLLLSKSKVGPGGIPNFSTDSLDLPAQAADWNLNPTNYTLTFGDPTADDTESPTQNQPLRNATRNKKNPTGNNNGSTDMESSTDNYLTTTNSNPNAQGQGQRLQSTPSKTCSSQEYMNTDSSSAGSFNTARTSGHDNAHLSKSIQTSAFTSTEGSSNEDMKTCGQFKERLQQSPIYYICYPNYTLPNLEFLKNASKDDNTKTNLNQYQKQSNKKILLPQALRSSNRPQSSGGHSYHKENGGIGSHHRRPLSLNDLEKLRNTTIQDWDSLEVLLPKSIVEMLSGSNTLNKIIDGNKQINCHNIKDNRIQEESTRASALPQISKMSCPRTFENCNVQMRRRSENTSGGVSGIDRRNRIRRRKGYSCTDLPDIREMTEEITKNLEEYNCVIEANGFLNTPASSGSYYYNSQYNAADGGAVAPHNSPLISGIGGKWGGSSNVAPNIGMRGASNDRNSSCSSTTSITSTCSTMMLGDMERALLEEIQFSVNNVLELSAAEGTPQINSSTTCAAAVLNQLCPALYALFSHGLLPCLDTIFGRIPNTAWRVVEASIQYGPTTRSQSSTLAELVMRINSEELLIEGPMKFNAFICGLLNLGTIQPWFRYFRTQDRLLRTYYCPTGFLYNCNTSTCIRQALDTVLNSIQQLKPITFQLDMFHEIKSVTCELAEFKKYGTMLANDNRFNKSSKLGSKTEKVGKKSSRVKGQTPGLQMKRSYSDERPSGTATRPASTKNPSSIPKSKTAINLSNQKQQLQVRHEFNQRAAAAAVAGAVVAGSAAGSSQRPAASPGTHRTTTFEAAAHDPVRLRRPTTLQQRTGANRAISANIDLRHDSNPQDNRFNSDDNVDEKGMRELMGTKGHGRVTSAPPPQRPKSLGSYSNMAEAQGSDSSSGGSGGASSNPRLPLKFRQLQLQWELMSGTELPVSPGSNSAGPQSPSGAAGGGSVGGAAAGSSKIPRPITSPVTSVASGLTPSKLHSNSNQPVFSNANFKLQQQKR